MSGVRGRSGGINRLPTEVKRLQGTLRKSRTKPAEPKPPTGIPKAPEWLSAAGKRLYRRLGRLVAVARVGTHVDGEALALAAHALEEFTDADTIVRAEGSVLKRITATGESKYRHPAALARSDAWRRYREALRAFGMDPQSRGTVSANAEEIPDPANRFFQ